MDRLSSSVWSMIISKSQEKEEEYESLHKIDAEVFTSPKINKKPWLKKN